MIRKKNRGGTSRMLMVGLGLGLLLVVLSFGWWLHGQWSLAKQAKGCTEPADLFTITQFQGRRSVRFAVLGDAGTGGQAQIQVALALKKVCEQKGCDFVLYLGDNIYPNGVQSVDDPKFESAFAQIYQDSPQPFFVVLGNHDVRGDAEAQRLYSLKNPQWRMPNFNYHVEAGPVDLYGVNSNCIPLSWGWLKSQLEANTAGRWKMVFTHHNLYSSDFHGDAPWPLRWWWAGQLAEQVDFFFSGHEHTMEHLIIPGVPGEYFISGAGGYPNRMNTKPPRREGSKYLSRSPGLLWVHAEAQAVGLEFFDLYGAPLYQYQKERPK